MRYNTVRVNAVFPCRCYKRFRNPVDIFRLLLTMITGIRVNMQADAIS